MVLPWFDPLSEELSNGSPGVDPLSVDQSNGSPGVDPLSVDQSNGSPEVDPLFGRSEADLHGACSRTSRAATRERTHVRTAPYYPQSNGEIERFHRTIKHDALRRFEPSDPEQARQIIARFGEHYNQVRLHSAVGYVTPADMLDGYPGNDLPGRRDSRIALGQTESGRYLQVVYVQDPDRHNLFVVTAYDLRGKALTAYRRVGSGIVAIDPRTRTNSSESAGQLAKSVMGHQ